MNQLERDSIKLTPQQEQFILGTLLGDGCIRIQQNGNFPALSILHSKHQHDYVVWKYNKLAELCSAKPKDSNIILNGKPFSRCEFRTLSLPCLMNIYNMATTDKKRVITQDWLDKIYDPMALAVWYMDDGFIENATHKITGKTKTRLISFAMGIATQGECDLLTQWLEQYWDVKFRTYTATHRSGKYMGNVYRYLRCSGIENIETFINLIEPYVIPSMNYKTHIFH